MRRFRESVNLKSTRKRDLCARTRTKRSEPQTATCERRRQLKARTERHAKSSKLPVEHGKGLRRLESEEVCADDGDCRASDGASGGLASSRWVLQLVDRDVRRKMNSKIIGDQTKEKPGRPAGRGVSTARRKEPDIAREKTRRRVC
jgi:hypothetical protein